MTAVTRTGALSLARTVLRILIVGNWVYGAAILALLVATPTRPWILSALGLPPSPEADRVVMGLRGIAIVGLAAVPLVYFVLTRLLAIVETVRAGNPFAPANALRLDAIGWALLALQLLSLLIGAIAGIISTPAHPIDVDAGISIGGWLTVILTFVLARVFADAAPTATQEAVR